MWQLGHCSPPIAYSCAQWIIIYCRSTKNTTRLTNWKNQTEESDNKLNGDCDQIQDGELFDNHHGCCGCSGCCVWV